MPIAPALPDDAVVRAKLDELGEVRRRLALCEPDEQREKVLEDEIQDLMQTQDPGRPVAMRGDAWEIQGTPCRNERTITDKKAAFSALGKALGMDGLIAVIEIGLGVLDKNLPESALARFVTKERSGHRTLKAVPLNPVADLPKAA